MKPKARLGQLESGAHHDVEGLPLEPGPFAQCVGVELGRQAPQELRFEDVAAAAVGQEAALVQLHLLGGRLEVQGHWKTVEGPGQASPLGAAQS